MRKAMTTPLIAHLERHLGPIVRSYASHGTPRVPVAIFADRPAVDASTCCTLGLSKHLLSGAAGTQRRQELLGCWWSRHEDLGPELLLSLVAEDVLATRVALRQGQVLGPRGPIVRTSTLEAFYCAPPSMYFPD